MSKHGALKVNYLTIVSQIESANFIARHCKLSLVRMIITWVGKTKRLACVCFGLMTPALVCVCVCVCLCVGPLVRTRAQRLLISASVYLESGGDKKVNNWAVICVFTSTKPRVSCVTTLQYFMNSGSQISRTDRELQSLWVIVTEWAYFWAPVSTFCQK